MFLALTKYALSCRYLCALHILCAEFDISNGGLAQDDGKVAVFYLQETCENTFQKRQPVIGPGVISMSARQMQVFLTLSVILSRNSTASLESV